MFIQNALHQSLSVTEVSEMLALLIKPSSKSLLGQKKQTYKLLAVRLCKEQRKCDISKTQWDKVLNKKTHSKRAR